jgi:phosphoribosylamine--glycine ligase
VFHAGTKPLADGTILTAGGRVLTVTGLGPDVAAARNVAYQAAGLIDFAGKQMRTDIAASVVG